MPAARIHALTGQRLAQTDLLEKEDHAGRQTVGQSHPTCPPATVPAGPVAQAEAQCAVECSASSQACPEWSDARSEAMELLLLTGCCQHELGCDLRGLAPQVCHVVCLLLVD